jgi:hypothetical protein
VLGLSLLEAWENACLASTALLVSVVTWYPPLFKEDAHDMHASPDELPELKEFLGSFRCAYGGLKGGKHWNAM